MWKLRTLILLPILLFACRPINVDLPVATAVPDNNTGEVPSDSPRLATDAPPAATTLPPTWTPRPLESNQLLPQTSNTVTDSGSTVVQGTAVPTYDGPSISYVVKRGDTLAEICIEYTAPITDVARINNITNWDHIEVGQVLIIPSEE
jgi:nucleoid-associated protein YgaU